jgi:hypothetical protein
LQSFLLVRTMVRSWKTQEPHNSFVPTSKTSFKGRRGNSIILIYLIDNLSDFHKYKSHPLRGGFVSARASGYDTRYVRNRDDQSPTSSSPVLTARCTMYAQKALNLNKGVKLCLSKIVCYTFTLVVVVPFERSFDQTY